MKDSHLTPVMDDARGNSSLRGHPTSERAWIMTFADLAALMLTFFVMMFAMSGVKSDLWRSTVNSLTQALHLPPIEWTVVPVARHNSHLTDDTMDSNLDYLGTVLKETLQGDALLSQGTIVREPGALVLAFPSKLLFSSADAEVSAPARRTLTALGGQLRNIGNPVGVNGYASEEDAESSRYGSSWALSVARASAVAGILTDAGYNRPLKIFGRALAHPASAQAYGRSEFESASNRVDIVILPRSGGR